MPANEAQRILTSLLEHLLGDLGLAVVNEEDSLTVPSLELTLHPELVGANESGGSAQTCSIIRCQHPRLFPEGVFEYQHAIGESLDQSIVQGLEQWTQLDLPVLQDALVDDPASCSTMEMTFPEKVGQPAYTLRIILGPVTHLGLDQGEGCEDDEEIHSSGCPCCLLTNSMEAFRPQLEAPGEFFAVRLFASRHDDGAVQADCRVNGEDWIPGSEALTHYANTWPQQGFEIRKQYVVIQPKP